MSDNEEYAIVCMRVEAVETPVLGSIKEVCAKCGEEIWIDPLMLAAAAEEGYAGVLVCLECYDWPQSKQEIREAVERSLDLIQKRVERN